MVIVEPGKGDLLIERDGSGLRITIPAAIQLFSVLFLSVWLTFWAIGEVVVLRSLLGGEDAREPGLFIWLALWTLGGALALYALLWQLTGEEIIELNSTMLRRRRRILFFSRSREFAVAHISNLRLAPPRPKFIRGRYVIDSPMTRTGLIAFDYGRTTHHLGHGLDEAKARYVLEKMYEQVTSLR